MGQGSRILLVNKTPYRWKKVYEHAYQMNSWTGNGVFPETILPGTSINAYVEFDEWVGKIMDDGGEVRYALEGTGGKEIEVRVHADGDNQYHTYVKCMGFDTTVCKSGQEVELGWWHDGCEVFVLGWDAKSARFYALASRQSASEWMNFVDGKKKISDLTIPGTHDTCAYTVPLNVGAACQTMDVTGQLHAGIRYLDMRLKRGSDNDGVLWLYHASVPLNLRFEQDVLPACYAFLRANPSETILMSVKQEDGDGPAIYDWLKPMIERHPDMWHLSNDSVPTLDKVRRKIVLFRRFKTADVGLDTETGWPDNYFNSFENHGVKFRVQDKYKIFTLANMDDKYDDYVHSMLDDAKKPENSNRIFINFASGTGALTPQTLATGYLSAKDGTNVHLHRYMEGSLSGRYGIIPMDYPEYPNQSLVPLLISQNF
jgi:1-phosphatidylinositol phosphodiesterase